MKKVISMALTICFVMLLSACTTNDKVDPYGRYNENMVEDDNYNDNDNNVDAQTNDNATTQNEEPTCSHAWISADCTSPKTCSKCNITSGSAKGHKWESATCQSPKKCKTCGISEGEIGNCKDNGKGKCKYCGTDLVLSKIKKNLTLQLIVPSVSTNNYYFQVKYVNHTGSAIKLSYYVSGNGKLCGNSQSDGYKLADGYEIAIPYYRATIYEDRFEDRYKDMYLDNSSLAYTNVKLNGETIFVRFGTSGITQVGRSLQEIGVY